MKLKIVLILIMILFVTTGLFAQKKEKLSFTEFRADGVLIGNVTVNAIFLGWSQQQISRENNFQVIWDRFNDGNGWSDWEFTQRYPSYHSSLRQSYDIFLSSYYANPRAAVRIYYEDGVIVQLFTIPNGRASPFWWSDDGKSFNIMYEVWEIVN